MIKTVLLEFHARNFIICQFYVLFYFQTDKMWLIRRYNSKWMHKLFLSIL